MFVLTQNKVLKTPSGHFVYHTKFLSLLFIVNVDQYLKHQNDKTKTDALIHFVNFRDNTIMEVDQVLRMIDYKTEELDPIFKAKIHKIVQKRLKMERDLLKNIIHITKVRIIKDKTRSKIGQ